MPNTSDLKAAGTPEYKRSRCDHELNAVRAEQDEQPDNNRRSERKQAISIRRMRLWFATTAAASRDDGLAETTSARRVAARAQFMLSHFANYSQCDVGARIIVGACRHAHDR